MQFEDPLRGVTGIRELAFAAGAASRYIKPWKVGRRSRIQAAGRQRVSRLGFVRRWVYALPTVPVRANSWLACISGTIIVRQLQGLNRSSA